MIHLNYAIALRRENRIDDALAHLELVIDGEAVVIAASVRAEILTERHQLDDAIAAARAALHSEADAKDLAYLHMTLADALLEKGARSEALASAWDAIALDRGNERAQWIIREIEGQRSDSAKVFHLSLRGRWERAIDDEDRGFYVSYSVVADDEDEAVRLASRFEPEHVRASLTLNEAKEEKKCGETLPKGVYWAAGRAFFPEDDE
jgi:tetratricopeptide (TPR) repeat protein